MTSMQSLKLLNKSYREHVMLLYNNRNECDSAAIDMINEGLGDDYVCIYASVFNSDKFHLDKMSRGIKDYKENIDKGNLLIIDFQPFYKSALVSNLAPFVKLKKNVEEIINRRIKEGKGAKILIFAEAAGALSEHCHFDKSIDLEKWWYDIHDRWIKNGANITVICPHPRSHEKSGFNINGHMSKLHSLTLDLEHQKKSKGMRILIVEPEEDIQQLYQRYLDFRGMNVVSVREGKKCLEYVFSTPDKGFDLIIMDMHLKDISCIWVAQKIKNAIPDQKIILTTTVLDNMDKEIQSIGINIEDILIKPFRLSRLYSIIKAQ